MGYNMDIMRQSVCLVVNQIIIYSYGFLFDCTTVGQASDSIRVAYLEIFFSSDYLWIVSSSQCFTILN